jgi:hypothetical protein
MKFKIFIGLIVLVFGTFVIVLCKPEPADMEMNQVQKKDLTKMTGLEWNEEQERNVLDRFNEIEAVILDLFQRGKYLRIGHIFEKFGTVIINAETGETITGRQAIGSFFENYSTRALTFGNELVVDGGVIEKRMGGQKINKWAKVTFEIHFSNKTTLQNQTHGGGSLLFHRNDCPWDG